MGVIIGIVGVTIGLAGGWFFYWRATKDLHRETAALRTETARVRTVLGELAAALTALSKGRRVEFLPEDENGVIRMRFRYIDAEAHARGTASASAQGTIVIEATAAPVRAAGAASAQGTVSRPAPQDVAAAEQPNEL